MEFNYKAKTVTGEILGGVIEAPDEKTAVEVLHSKSYVLLSLDLIKKDLFYIDLKRIFVKPGNKDIVIFTRQLATLIDADMPLLESLRTMALQVEKESFGEIIGGISKYVESGSSLSDAIGNYPNLFSSFYVSLVRSGESTGKLHDSLMYLATYLERSQELKSKIKGALTYPAFILFSIVIVTFIMAIWVLPNLLSIFEEVGVTDLPLTTRLLIVVIHFINKFLYLILAGAFALIIYALYFLKTPQGKNWLDNFKLNVPYFGVISRNFYLSRISEGLSTLIKAGIPIIDALNTTASISNNNTYKIIVLDAQQKIKEGHTMSDAFKDRQEIPLLFSSMVAIGEKTGKLSQMLEHVAKFYKAESENTIQTISQLIEPVMVLALGIAVAILVSSILLPMYNLVGSF